MSNSYDKKAHKGVPIGIHVNDYMVWDEFSPDVGPIKDNTILLEEADGHPGGTYSTYDAEDTLKILWGLAKSFPFRDNLHVSAKEVYDKCAESFPEKDFFKNTNKSAMNDEQIDNFINTLLSAEGLSWFQNYNKGNVTNYVEFICENAEIPYLTETLLEMHKGFEQKVLGFSSTGKKIKKEEKSQFNKKCHEAYCWINSYIYDIDSPDHREIGVILDSPFEFGEKGNIPQIKNIESSVEKLLSNKNGDYVVTVPYATNDDNSSGPCNIVFDNKRTLKIYVKNPKDAADLAIYWEKFNQSVEIEKLNEKEKG